jgi:hypothetical protein
MIKSSFGTENTDTQPILLGQGLIHDRIGPKTPPEKGVYGDDVRQQTFTIISGRNSYDLSTKVLHETHIIDGTVTNKVIIISP